MAYSDFDVEFSTRTQADAATAGGDMVSPPAGVPYQNSGLSDPLTTTGDYCRAIQHNAASQSDASVGQVKMLLANTGSVSAQAFYDVGHDQLISMRLRVRMGRVEGPDAADSADNFLTLAGITAFTSGSTSVYSGGYELVFQVKGSGALRAASVALRASQPVDFSGSVASLLAARTVECSGSYAFDQWHYLRLDLVPVSSTQKTLVAYASADDGVSWSEIGSMTVRSSDPEWSGLSPNRAGIISLRCGEPAATEFYNHFVDGFEARAEAQAANASPSVDAGFSAQSAQEGQVFTYTFPETAFADADGDSLTYVAALADGSALPAWLSFDAATRTFSGTPAAGDVASLTIAVTATDPSGAFERSTFALSVAAANQAPTAIALSASSLYENAAGGTLVGTLSGTDPENDALTFAITGGTGAALFEIVNGTELRSQAGATFDYETTQSYTLDIQASDGQLTYSETFTIDVLDVDEVPPAQPVVTVNGDFTLTVDNAEAGATVEYSLDQAAWSTTQPVAQEGENTVYVRQTDAAGNVSTVATVAFTKDTTAPSIAGNAAVSVVENTTAVATYTSEAGVVWSISGADAALFDLVGGVLSFKAAPDYETPGDAGGDNIYDIIVEATDAAGNKGTLAVAVTVTDANEAPSNLALSSTSVDEGTSGAVVGILSVTDPDADDTIVYTVQSNADKFDTQNGNELVTKVALNYGDATSYSVVIRATDFFGDYVEETFQIDVNNVNYAPTGSVTISGTAQVGETLTASNTLADADGMGTVSYAWFYADSTPLGSGATYVVQASDVGAEIFVRASYTDAQGTAESVDSALVGPAYLGLVGRNLTLHLDAGDSASYPGSGTTWSDLSSNSLNATLYGDTAYSTDGGGSLVFDGTGDYARVNHNAALNPAQITVSVWAYRANWAASGDRVLLSKAEGGGYYMTLSPGALDSGNPVGKMYFTLYDGSAYRAASHVNTDSLAAGWHHFVGTFDGQVQRIYVDGVESSSYTHAAALDLSYGFSGTQPLLLGAEANSIGVDTNNPRYFDGKLAQVLIYNDDLTAAEVLQNFNETKSRFGL